MVTTGLEETSTPTEAARILSAVACASIDACKASRTGLDARACWPCLGLCPARRCGCRYRLGAAAACKRTCCYTTVAMGLTAEIMFIIGVRSGWLRIRGGSTQSATSSGTALSSASRMPKVTRARGCAQRSSCALGRWAGRHHEDLRAAAIGVSVPVTAGYAHGLSSIASQAAAMRWNGAPSATTT
jgi:hypothetical protein